MAGAKYGGISSIEIDAACRLLQMPATEWPTISQGVRVMSLAIAEHYRQQS